MPNFRIGQQVVCLLQGTGWKDENNTAGEGPKKGDICKISGFSSMGDYINLLEYPQQLSYNINKFRPLDSTDHSEHTLDSLVGAMGDSLEKVTIKRHDSPDAD